MIMAQFGHSEKEAAQGAINFFVQLAKLGKSMLPFI
jgi:hypothetical protein